MVHLRDPQNICAILDLPSHTPEELMLVIGLGTTAAFLYMSGLGGPDGVHRSTLAALMHVNFTYIASVL